MPKKHIISLYVQYNPLPDIIVDNLEKDCAYIYSPQYRTLFETILTHRTLRVAPAGSGLNTARVAQWVRQHVLQKPGRVMYVGSVGKDKHGDQICSAAEADGFTMKLEVSSGKRSGLCAVCRDGNSRTLAVHPSSASSLSDDFVNSAAVQEGQRSAKTIYTTAYANVFRVRQTLQLMTSSRCHTLPDGSKQLAAMGLSNKRVLDDFGEDLVDVLGKLDIITGNQEEIHDLAMMLQWVPSEMSDMELAKKIATETMPDQHGVRRVIMTHGVEPIIYATSAGESGEAKLMATDAGDAFAGGFLAAMAAKPDDLAFCCRLGAQAATFVINHSLVTLRTDEASLAELQA
ncbi:pfkB carbohydrate kinase family protein [Leishmania donovani]|uniref:Adenosine kinase n=1 Tax=Leishmania donovani TaxID=5661 RepID=A0A504X9L8_LEIDO|nr:pfkB carbohydrate kinase family protein [Leishmania donovani]